MLRGISFRRLRIACPYGDLKVSKVEQHSRIDEMKSD